MKDWLAKLAEQTKSEDEVLHEQLQNLSPEVIQELAYEFDPSTRPTQLDSMVEKIAQAQRMGAELAHEHGDELEKQAFLPLLAGLAGRAAIGQGVKSLAGSVVKNVAKDAIVNGATKAVSSAVRPPASMGGGPMGAAPGGFNYGKVAFDLKGLGRMAAGAAYRHPGAALTLAGAGVGAMMAPRDPQTGQKQYLRGAMMGGGLAAGAHALSDGRLGNMAKKMVTRQNNPLLGQGARRYMIESAAATRPGLTTGGAGQAAMSNLKSDLSAAHNAGPVMSSKAPAAPAASPGMFEGWVPPSYRGGPTTGAVKLASIAQRLRVAYMAKLAAGATPALFSTKLSPTRAAGAVMGGGMKGLQTATKSVTPPPRPMARPAQGTGTFAAPAGPSPFAAAPRQAPAAGGNLAAVQNQLNSSRSIAGGGPMMPGGGAVVHAAPGSGW